MQPNNFYIPCFTIWIIKIWTLIHITLFDLFLHLWNKYRYWLVKSLHINGGSFHCSRSWPPDREITLFAISQFMSADQKCHMMIFIRSHFWSGWSHCRKFRAGNLNIVLCLTLNSNFPGKSVIWWFVSMVDWNHQITLFAISQKVWSHGLEAMT